MSAELASRLDEHATRLGWDADTLAAHQRDRLRALLAHAAAHSPFHARRLRGVDAGRFEIEDLPRLPVMTKAQMMDAFDEVVTDGRLNRRLAERHLAAAADTGVPRVALDEYVCLGSGGSSGLRGLFVQRLSEYAELIAAFIRPVYVRTMTAGGPPREELVAAMVGATSPVHSTGFFTAVATGPPVRVIPAPTSLPLPDIVARLNAAQPPALVGYSVKLAELAREQLAGRLAISPRSVTTGGPVASDSSAVIERAFGVPPANVFGSSEGLTGMSEPGGSLLTFASDLCLAEPVDEDNRPVPPGIPSAKVLLTNLHNVTQPLIRYELTDRFVIAPGAPESGWLRASVHGRAGQAFTYGTVTVDWIPIRNVLDEAAVHEYQVRQVPGGIDVDCVADDPLDVKEVTARLSATLRQAGMPRPQVSVRLAEELPRDPHSGKVRPFVPVPQAR